MTDQARECRGRQAVAGMKADRDRLMQPLVWVVQCAAARDRSQIPHAIPAQPVVYRPENGRSDDPTHTTAPHRLSPADPTQKNRIRSVNRSAHQTETNAGRQFFTRPDRSRPLPVPVLSGRTMRV